MTTLPGIGSHQSHRAGTDEWLTPPFILNALGPFDLDPCAPSVRPWPMATHHYTESDNGLMRPWFGRVWMNPPYGAKTGRWLSRLVEHGIGTALVFARTETKFFFKHVWDDAAAVFFLYQRLHFHYVDGRAAAYNSGAPSVLIAYGKDDAQRLADSGLEGKFIPLRLPRFIALLAASENPSWRQQI